MSAARRQIDLHAPAQVVPGQHFGPWPVDPALRARIKAANEAGFRTALDGPGIAELLQDAEALGVLV